MKKNLNTKFKKVKWYYGQEKNIPREWRWSNFGSEGKLRSGATPRRDHPEYYKGDILWVSSGELNFDPIYNTEEKITELAIKKTKLQLHTEGTFLFAITGLEAKGTRGRCALLGTSATTNQSCMAFYDYTSLLSNFIIQYYLQFGEKIIFALAQGTKQQSLNLKLSKSIKIPVPSLLEQQRIASILSNVDALIQNTQDIIDKTEKLKKGLMQQLLTKGIGHKKFKKVKWYFRNEIKIPIEWNIDYLYNHTKITTGDKDTQNKIQDGKYPFFVRSKTIERINSYSYDGEAVLTAGDGDIGKIFHYINGKFDFHQRVYKISDYDVGLDGLFFYFYFSKNFYNRAKSMSAKNTVDSIRMDMITKMLILLPPLPEQKQIASILSEIALLHFLARVSNTIIYMRLMYFKYL